MANSISPEQLNDMFQGDSTFALIDVREAGEYNSSHIPGSSLISRRHLEAQIWAAMPHLGTHVVVCDDDQRRADLSASTLESLGYTNVSVLAGGLNRWVSRDFASEWGTNVPSKDFGEKMEVVHHVPEIDADELHSRIERGDKLVILDTRTPEEYQRFCIPGGRSVPGGELALRITDITKELDDDTTVIVNCAGRTRSIIGTRMLQRMGVTNAVGLKNGTSGWVLAGYELETGADRLDLPEPSGDGTAAAEAYANRLASEDGVSYISVSELQDLQAKAGSEPIYFIDVRTEEEYEAGHIPGFRWFAGGQAVQRSDDVAVVHNCPVVFCCDGTARATFTGSWYRQLGVRQVYAVNGGAGAWTAAGHSLEQGMPESVVLGREEAASKVKLATPLEFINRRLTHIVHVSTSQDFARGHIAGSRWIARGWLELRIEEMVPSKNTPIGVVCTDGRNSLFAGASLADMGYDEVWVLEEGMAGWREDALDIEQGLTGVMSPPSDMVPAGPDRNYADAIHYLRWETQLGEKYAGTGG